MLAERRQQIVKRRAQPTVVYAVIEIIVRPQKQGNALAGQQPVRQHLRQHATGPHLLFARADDKHAALPGGAGRQPDAVAPDLRREIAIRLAALRAGQHRLPAQPGGIHPVKLRHHQRLVHLRPFGERPAVEALKIGLLLSTRRAKPASCRA